MFRGDDGFRKLRSDRGNPLVSCRRNQRRVRLQILAMDDNSSVAINWALQNLMRRGSIVGGRNQKKIREVCAAWRV
jgi:hypothetical protein